MFLSLQWGAVCPGFQFNRVPIVRVDKFTGCRLSASTNLPGAVCPPQQIYWVPFVRLCKKTLGADCPGAVCLDTASCTCTNEKAFPKF